MQEETEAGQAFIAQLSLSTALGDKYCYRPHFTDGTQVPKATRGGSGPSGCRQSGSEPLRSVVSAKQLLFIFFSVQSCRALLCAQRRAGARQRDIARGQPWARPTAPA